MLAASLGAVLDPAPGRAAPDSAAAAGTASFLLIDGGAPSGQARLTGCDRAISDLHASLDSKGAQNTVLIAPTAGALRDALLRFGDAGAGTSHAVLFCGYAAENGGNIFALGSDFASHDDPALSAVSVRAFSRVAGGGNGLVMLDLHPMVVEGTSVAAVAGALDGAAGAWSGDTTLAGTRLAATDRQPGDATLIDKAARSGAATPDGIAGASARPPAKPVAPPALPTPAPQTPTPPPVAAAAPAAAAQPGPGVAAAPPAATATGGTGKPETAGPVARQAAPAATSGDTATAAHPAGTGSEAGAIALAPKAAGAPALPRRPRVHADPAVQKAQVALLARGLFNGRVNGVNSPDTQEAVRHFQAMLGHPATGQLTPDETRQLTGG